MEVPDWEGGPGQDYPSLSAPAEAPISLNAQKKAKRKRKQQQTHLQALLDEPIHLMLHQPRNEGTDPHKTKKPRLSPDRHAIKPAAQIQTAACSQRSDDTPAGQDAVPAKARLPESTQSKSAGPQQATKAAQIAQARLPKGNKQLHPRTAGGLPATTEQQHTTVKGQSASFKGQQASVKGQKALALGPSGSGTLHQALMDGQPVSLKGSTTGGTVTAKRMLAPSMGQPLNVNKKQKTSAAIETDSLSKADMAQLMALAQEASLHDPDPVMPLTSKSTHPVASAAAAAAAAAAAKHNLMAAGNKPPSKGPASNRASAAAAPATAATSVAQSGRSQDSHMSKSSQPKAKKQKLTAKQTQSADTRSAAAGVSHLSPAAATASEAAVTSAGAAAAADDPDEAGGSASGGKQKKKMGRKARLRLKRQAFRQQTGVDDAPDGVSTVVAAQPGKVAVAKRAMVKATKGTAEPIDGQLAQLYGQKPGSQKQSAPPHGQSEPASAAGTPEQLLPGSASDAKKSKKKGKQDPLTQTLSAAGKPLPAGSSDTSKKKSKSLLEQMRSKLFGGRFRMLNEQLYTSEGEDAFNMMQGQPDLFEQYHEGFREQTQHWPVQPIDLAISWLKKKSPAWVAADFGCGDAQLARSVPQTVHSFDLVAAAPGVTACNMADTPLEDSSVDAAVFCLALMGTDYGSFLTEACRVLRMGGLLWIAEVRSRFADSTSSAELGSKDVSASFVVALKKLGLHVTRQDSSNKMFVVFEAKKADSKSGAVLWPELKPCMYKRR
ncbi:MAG: ribosomal RNA-processing 8-like [Trebouxia sp. A1-2]|nr:MAG: ribosomal RNA-processing 8-like [Trebouxia sp. A1-2]